jgi:hypothetical protein
MGNPYLADFLNADGSVRFGGAVTFTDPGNQPGGAGSQTVVWWDLGVVDFGAAAVAGKTVLVPAAPGRLISSVRFGSDGFVPEPNAGCYLITPNTPGFSGYAALGTEATDTGGLYFNSQVVSPGLSGTQAQILDGGPLVACCTLPTKEFVAPVAWEADTAYPLDTCVVDANGHFFEVTQNGVSGATIPDFEGHESGTVTDGTITWTDDGVTPGGKAHLYAEVIETDNPSPPYPASLQFVQQPTDSTEGVTISPAITVRILDQHGDPFADIAMSIVLRVVGTATSVNGTTSQTTVAGVATFDDLAVNDAGTYIFRASLYPTVVTPDVDSDPFTITV